jgi:hypothetical protein
LSAEGVWDGAVLGGQTAVVVRVETVSTKALDAEIDGALIAVLALPIALAATVLEGVDALAGGTKR